MRKLAALSMVAAGALMVGCSDVPTDASAVAEVTTQLDAKGKPGGGDGTSDPTATFVFPASGTALLSDGGGDYKNGTCGVEAKIFATEAASNSGDATLNTKKGKCTRRLRIAFGPEDVEEVRVFVNVKNIQNTTTIIPIGGEVIRGMNVNPWEGSRCENLHFRENLLDGTPVPGNFVKVTRTDVDTWQVYNEPGADSAACDLGNGIYQAVTLPVSFTIKSSVPLPTS